MATENPVKKILRISLLVGFFLFIIIYAFFISHDLIFGVKIKNVNLDGLPMQSGSTVTKNVIKITGNAKNAVKLTLNGREISIDQAGNFEETIALLSGYNMVSIGAVDQFEYSDEKDYQIIYK
jgi:hypothetical protein